MSNIVKMSEVKDGQLFRFKGRSEVYKMLDNSFWLKSFCFAMYAEKKIEFKKTHNKGSNYTDRTVEIVQFY